MMKPVMDGVFAINKPSGLTSRFALDRVTRALSKAPESQEALAVLQAARSQAQQGRRSKTTKLKMGHGGTLDPLAEGVLVIGIGSGTKKLGDYTNGSVKHYECVGLLGGSTTTGDSEGELLQKTGINITKEMLTETREKMIGEIEQTPPIFSALKMDGKPLYEYAREGKPLPRNIKGRNVTIHDIKLYDDSLNTDHEWNFLKSEKDQEGNSLVTQLASNPTLNDHDVPFSKKWLEKAEKENLKTDAAPVQPVAEGVDYEKDGYRAPTLHFDAKVSSGTYIRSLLSDFARAMGSSSYMVKLVRWQQAEWDLKKNVFEIEDFEKYKSEIWLPVLEKVFVDSNVDIRSELEKQIQQCPEGVKSEEELAAEKKEEEERIAQAADRKRNTDSKGKGKKNFKRQKKY
ncbi:pseudouridine synthase [Martiniozyma asiatica (nom. inval.)]|nr:pseudouridine synthase [Martiniozyma asiatica]